VSLSPDIYLRRLERMRAQLPSIGADGVYATPCSNLLYLTGIDFHRSERLTALFLFKDRAPFVLCPAFEEARLRGMSAVSEIYTWQETEDPFRKAASLMPAGRGTLAVEPSTAFEDVERLLADSPGWRPVSAGPIFGPVRMVKETSEID